MKGYGFLRIVILFCILSVSGLILAENLFSLELRSDAFENGKFIPELYTYRGENVSPALNWVDVPEGTKSFVLIMDDPDAPLGTWIHWVIYNIPGDARGLEENIPPRFVLDDGSRQGVNSFRRAGYGGPSPPPGPAHRYFFKLYALDTVLDVLPGATKGAVVRAMQGHILGSAQLVGLFKR